MALKPDDYYLALGKVAFAIGQLEDCFIVFTFALSETTDEEKLKVELIWEGFAKNIKTFRKLVKKRFTKHYQDQLLPIIAQADTLRIKRNENLHALWQVMVDADTGNFSHVARFRSLARKGAPKSTLDVHTPLDSELTGLAQEIQQCANELQRAMKNSYDLDENVQKWRAEHGY